MKDLLNDRTEYYAHSPGKVNASDWHYLETHLKETAQRASEMAKTFGCSQWGYLAGLWHDIGKYSAEFQNYIRKTADPDAHIEGKLGRVDHSTAGALHAVNRMRLTGRLLAYIIAGHHAGLTDYESDETGRAALSQRLKNNTFSEALQTRIPDYLLNWQMPRDKPPPAADPAIWIRMLFSCVVDADFLDTEAFFDPGKAEARTGYSTIPELLPLFSEFMRKKQAEAERTEVNNIRAEILAQCTAKSASKPGIYTLTVPTGGGKTLSSMAFALNHAVKYDKQRIIYVIPYTSIIEQTADQFREIFKESVVEHHSNLDVADASKENTRSRLASENWDAPIIVTTSVQFFESLFASRTSRCRKLHNIVNSVVVLDEAQLLPPDYLNPTLHVLTELQKNYGVTLLLSTATQPALGPHESTGELDDFKFKGLPITPESEIMEDPLTLYNKLKRVEISVPADLNTPTDWEELAEELEKHPSVLCIVNRRDDCRELWSKMPRGTFHLSALMCGEHRSTKIKQIKERLYSGLPTRVISTQLVEAGVDIDFPVVYRALAGLDSIAQAAGRCNREGKMTDKGKVVIFVPPSKTPPGHLRQAAEIGRMLLMQKTEDLLSPDKFESFFKQFYWQQGERLDKMQILPDLKMDGEFKCSFRSAAEKFKMIDDSQQASIIVMYEEGKELIKNFEKGVLDKTLKRASQRYTVNIPRHIHNQLLNEGAIKEAQPGIFVQVHPALYDNDIGLCPDKAVIEPDDLII